MEHTYIPGSSISVSAHCLFIDGHLIYTARAAIAEVALLNDQLFLLLATEYPEQYPDLAGRNFVSLNTSGKELWWAPQLNTRNIYEPKYPARYWTYYDLRIVDRKRPRIITQTSERSAAELDLRTGHFPPTKPDIVLTERIEGMQRDEALIFVSSHRLRDVAPYKVCFPRPEPPVATLT